MLEFQPEADPAGISLAVAVYDNYIHNLAGVLFYEFYPDFVTEHFALYDEGEGAVRLLLDEKRMVIYDSSRTYTARQAF